MMNLSYSKNAYFPPGYLSLGIGLLMVALLVFGAGGSVKAQEVPHYEADPSWPKLPLGDHWLTGGLGGICIDSRDHIYILNRQNVIPDDLDGAKLAPPVIELDPEGNVVGGWGDAEQLGDRLHDCHVDSDQNVWVVAAATGVLRKYSSDGSEMLLQVGESGRYDSADGSRQGRPLNSNRAQFFLPAALDVDADTGDIYVADGELPGANQRIAVLDRNGQFLRQWPLHRSESERDIRPLPHCLRLSNDDLVYVCDREADRIQVFDQMGNFIRNIDLTFEPFTSPTGRSSGSRGSAVVLAFSPDPQQQFIFVVNQNSVMIDVVDRQTGQLLTSFGDGPGRYPGQFTLPHGIAVDSIGNVYVAEQEGRRIQKFRIVAPN
jgi:DNA-binding beta-propeller fold protein YncE